MLKIFSFLLTIIYLTGCASPVVYYKPSGTGKLIQGDLYALNHKNRFEMEIADGVHLHITAQGYINSDSTFITIQVNVRKDSWVQFTTDMLTLTDDKGKIQTVTTGRTTLTGLPRLVTDKFQGGNSFNASEWGSFNLSMEIPSYRPKSFTLAFPDIIVNDQKVNVSPILFTLKKGIKFYSGIAS